jgi:hypothetical protein
LVPRKANKNEEVEEAIEEKSEKRMNAAPDLTKKTAKRERKRLAAREKEVRGWIGRWRRKSEDSN